MTCATPALCCWQEERQPQDHPGYLGPASLSMTLGVYSHVQAAVKDEAAAAMDSTFF
jgi:hypothetical protein